MLNRVSMADVAHEADVSLCIGLIIDRQDPYWVEVQEAVYQKAQQLPVELVSVNMEDYLWPGSNEGRMALVEELLAQELNALIGWWWPENLAYQILEFGLPIIHLSETDIAHPLSVSPLGLYGVARMMGTYLAEELEGQGNVLVLGGLLQAGMQDDGKSRVAGFQDSLRDYPQIHLKHIPSLWSYEQAYAQVYAAMQQLDRPIDAILGLSDSLALAARDAGRSLDLVDQHTLIVGINGDPLALAAIADGSMTATVDIFPTDLGCQATELAYQAAQGRPLPANFEYKSQLVTARNVAEVAAQKLIALANLPSRLVGVSRQQQQQRLIQLETSLEISHRIGSILDPRQLSHEIANLICAKYGCDQVQVYYWLEEEQRLILDQPDPSPANRTSISLAQSGVLGQALLRNEPIFIPDTRRSLRFAPDPKSPDTRSRIVLPIRLGDRILGLLDLHSHQSTRHMRQELVGLQSLADQLGIAMHNAQLYGEALEARAIAEKADQLKTRLLANVSHELRTPLDVILGHTRATLDSPNPYNVNLPKALLSDLQHTHRSAEHLLRVINDLLDLSRAEIDELGLSPEIIDPRSFLTDVFCSIADSVSRNETTWRMELPDRLPIIQADPVRLRQILLNLLGNARKFTDRGEIVLGAEVALPHLHIWVQDTGIGIPIDQQEQIFEPFATVERANRRREGIGLGLSITRRLVALHGGSMTLESRADQGSTFHVYLPLPNLANQPASLPALAQPVLLLISAGDQPASEIVCFSERQGLEVRQLRARAEIDTVLAEVQPAALAWDLTRASPSDWALVEQLRSYPQLCQIPFILYGQEQDGVPAVTIGMTNFVIKPVSGRTLLEAINALCLTTAAGPILIVEDDPQACDLYKSLVAKELPGYIIRTASDGVVALDIMAQEIPSLVILDLMMPEMDGFEVLERMRANHKTRRVPVLVMSGRLLTFDDIRRIEQHALVTVYSKDILCRDEIAASLHRSLFGTDTLPPHTSALVKRAVAYFQQYYSQSFSRRELARAIGVSENYLSQIFRQELGLSPWEFLNRYRIKQAKELLRSTTDSITAVAARVGFSDPAYFSRVFRKQTGASPSAYRAS